MILKQFSNNRFIYINDSVDKCRKASAFAALNFIIFMPQYPVGSITIAYHIWQFNIDIFTKTCVARNIRELQFIMQYTCFSCACHPYFMSTQILPYTRLFTRFPALCRLPQADHPTMQADDFRCICPRRTACLSGT